MDAWLKGLLQAVVSGIGTAGARSAALSVLYSAAGPGASSGDSRATA